jgi:cytochrome-b5 reductase
MAIMKLTYSLFLFSKVISQHSKLPSTIVRTMSSSSTVYTMPSSMKGPPVKALVPPGQCQFTDENQEVALIERTMVSPNAVVLRFGLPDPTKPLNLSTCACILATAEMDGESITRPYTPISTNALSGHFDLLVKHYGPTAHMSKYMHEMKIGDKIAFKHIGPNVKTQAPFPYKKIGMLVGGTGMTPMTQALHAVLGEEKDGPHVSMIYGSRKQEDILGKELMHKWAADYPDRFTLVDVLSDEAKDSDWTGERGHPSKELIAKYMPGPEEEDIQIFICGPPPMYNALTGPREDKELSGLLKEMGYKTEQVYKF